ncbi:MAG: ImmA/IrrE family metallo-endopeptidase [Erysipelotrichaceae bacterium]|nr:ImmA/IrrE family metallo-endopeptidase [Erysipelotrichaceae bacterium]
MTNILANCLFVKDKKRYERIADCVTSFNALYNKNNIIQDDIFNIVENYVTRHEMPFELLRYPIHDPNLSAFTFVREGRMFVVVNSALPLAQQIFATAHELYHIYCYFERSDNSLLQVFSFLETKDIDGMFTLEDLEANAFAGMLLAPKDRLEEQSAIYHLSYKNPSIQLVLKVMDIFGIPYKATVLRLFEEDKIDKKTAIKLLEISDDEINKQIEVTGKSERWKGNTRMTIRFGSLNETMFEMEQWEGITEERLKSDKERIEKLVRLLMQK